MRLRKIVFYLPLIIFLVIYALGAMLIKDIKVCSPIILMWLVLFLMSGILLSRDVFWGSVFGVLPAIHIIYMGTQYTGQAIKETPVGIIVLVFYIIRGGSVFYNNKK